MNYIEHKFKTKNGHIINNKYIPLTRFDTCIYCLNTAYIIINKCNDITMDTEYINNKSKNYLPCITEDEFIIKGLLE